MTSPIDLEPAVRRMADLIEATPEEALDLATPCAEYSLGDLLDHVAGSVAAFRAAAVKNPLRAAPSGDASNLPDDWRTRMPADLWALEAAWRVPSAWTGMTAAGGVDLPGDVAGVIALDEVVIHGWDVAKTLGQPADYDGPGLEAVLEQTRSFRALDVPGLFGPEVPIREDASLFEQVLGMTGRDPDWKP
jgi:uncharacterized protein (TIGR03086 family)